MKKVWKRLLALGLTLSLLIPGLGAHAAEPETGYPELPVGGWEPYEVEWTGSLDAGGPSLLFTQEAAGQTEGRHILWIDRMTAGEDAGVRAFYELLVSASAAGKLLAQAASFDKNAEATADALEPGSLYADGKGLSAMVISEVSETVPDQDLYRLAYAAFLLDHPEVFWLKPDDCCFKTIAVGEKQYFCMSLTGSTDKENLLETDLAATGESKTVEGWIEARDGYVDTILKAVTLPHPAKSEADTVAWLRHFNTWLTENNQPCTDNVEISRGSYTAISALEGREGEMGPVSAGYARAFQMLCHQVGINCVVTTGTVAGRESMWNEVEVGGKWYAVDVARNDPREAGKKSGYENLRFFLLGAKSITALENYADYRTFEISHPVGNAYFKAENGVLPVFPNGPALEQYAYPLEDMPFEVWTAHTDKHDQFEPSRAPAAPTCTETGWQICRSVRDQGFLFRVYEEKALPMTDHISSGAYGHDENEHWEICKDCGAEIPGTRKQHDWFAVEGTVPGKGTEIVQYMCLTCNHIIAPPVQVGLFNTTINAIQFDGKLQGRGLAAKQVCVAGYTKDGQQLLMGMKDLTPAADGSFNITISMDKANEAYQYKLFFLDEGFVPVWNESKRP